MSNIFAFRAIAVTLEGELDIKETKKVSISPIMNCFFRTMNGTKTSINIEKSQGSSTSNHPIKQHIFFLTQMNQPNE